jgi:transcriptional regulator with XRE-family HTH domain
VRLIDQGLRIKHYRKGIGYSQNKLAEVVKVSVTAVQNWERGRNDVLGKNRSALCRALKINELTLIAGGDGCVNTNVSPVGLLEDNEEVEVSILMSVVVTDGDLSLRKGKVIKLPKSLFDGCGVDESYSLCVFISGNSMEPRLFDGDMVVIDTKEISAVDGGVYAVLYEGLLKVMRLYKPGASRLRLNSFNALEHPDIMVDAESVNIIGKVFYSSSVWR